MLDLIQSCSVMCNITTDSPLGAEFKSKTPLINNDNA